MWNLLLATLLAVAPQAAPDVGASAHQRNEIARIAAELEARSAAAHPGQPRPLYSTGRRGAFAGYVMDCLNRIVLRSHPGKGSARPIRSGSAILFTLAIQPDGTVKQLDIISNDGGPALAARLRQAIRQAAPFPPFSTDMRKQHNEVIITRTLDYAGCASTAARCR